MRRTAIAVSLLVVAVAVGGCGGSDGSDGGHGQHPTTTATIPAAAAGGQTAAGKCESQQWPQPLPDFRGKRLADTVVGPALCYDITEVAAPDGSDVRQDPKALTTPWTITDQSPAPGTQVTGSTPVTLKVEAAQRN
ncbi:hypothetical protein NDR87_16440 [Nocardia sp. CDC159]|uniref:PASTA domain-containing protein n=1 Tax=Nocardia pulmonis TaxID=2951408 RepID=A0A9X2E6P4_9NOCA|nr:MULTISPECIES: hypothetical protein [Nocardia]MCM6775317.1 hypothetical protein [Nocardia pulmonis]MCM6787949.1 hypothetical protein [Nocardia sp. CDC159]